MYLFQVEGKPPPPWTPERGPCDRPTAAADPAEPTTASGDAATTTVAAAAAAAATVATPAIDKAISGYHQRKEAAFSQQEERLRELEKTVQSLVRPARSGGATSRGVEVDVDDVPSPSERHAEEPAAESPSPAPAPAGAAVVSRSSRVHSVTEPVDVPGEWHRGRERHLAASARASSVSASSSSANPAAVAVSSPSSPPPTPLQPGRPRGNNSGSGSGKAAAAARAQQQKRSGNAEWRNVTDDEQTDCSSLGTQQSSGGGGGGGVRGGASTRMLTEQAREALVSLARLQAGASKASASRGGGGSGGGGTGASVSTGSMRVVRAQGRDATTQSSREGLLAASSSSFRGSSLVRLLDGSESESRGRFKVGSNAEDETWDEARMAFTATHTWRLSGDVAYPCAPVCGFAEQTTRDDAALVRLQEEANELRTALGKLAGQLTARDGEEESVRAQLQSTQQQAEEERRRGLELLEALEAARAVTDKLHEERDTIREQLQVSCEQPGKTVQHHQSLSAFLRSVSLDVCVGSVACMWDSQSGVRGSVGVCCLGVVCVRPLK